jgi:5-methylthioadenosine/S-adenosylhomocysteine deaminase
MFSATWLTGLLDHVRGPEKDQWLTAAQLLLMATQGGAAALGLDGDYAIEPGSVADIAIVSVTQPPFKPLNDPFVQLVYGGAGRAVRTVIVAGEVRMEDGELEHIPVDAIGAEADEMARSLGLADQLSGRPASFVGPLTRIERGVRALQFPVDRFASTSPGLRATQHESGGIR